MSTFSIHCVDCSRLASYLAHVREAYAGYYARPVPPFGDAAARLLVVGLAPGKHGANATGRPFTGDYAGILLYETLHKFGFASQPQSTSADDALTLHDCRITNAVKCLPPENKPTPAEVKICNRYLAAELRTLPAGAVIVALGTIAHNAALQAFGLKQSSYRFAHGAEHALAGGFTLIDSYHCSRYNTQTKRLTAGMFEQVFAQAQRLLRTERSHESV